MDRLTFVVHGEFHDFCQGCNIIDFELLKDLSPIGPDRKRYTCKHFELCRYISERLSDAKHG